MRKLLSILLVITLMLSMAACGTDDGQAGDAKLEKSITMYVGAGVGGALDVRARIMAGFIEQDLGIKVAVLNKTGAAGTVAAGEMKNNPTSPHDLFFSGYSTFTSAPNFNDNLAFKGEDFTALASVDIEEFGLFISAKNKWGFETFEDVLNYGKTGTVIYGASPGGITHVYQAGLYASNNMKTSILAHGSAVEGISNILGDHSMISMAGLETARSYVESGDLIPVITYTAEEFKGYAGITVPTSASYNGDTFDGPMIISCLSNVDSAIKDILEGSIRKGLKDPATIAALEKVGLNYIPDLTREEIADGLKVQFKQIADLKELIS